jgi:hypothetical protein
MTDEKPDTKIPLYSLDPESREHRLIVDHLLTCGEKDFNAWWNIRRRDHHELTPGESAIYMHHAPKYGFNKDGTPLTAPPPKNPKNIAPKSSPIAPKLNR